MTPAWVIVEGPDGAGKTTLARRIVAELTERGATVSQHLTEKSDFSEYYTPPRMWVGSGLNVVQDRCALSDLVYAPVLSGVASRFGEAEVRGQLRTLTRHALVVHVNAEETDLSERLRERGDHLVDEGMLHAIRKNYWREMSWWAACGATVVEFDTTGGAFPSDLELQLALTVGLEDLSCRRTG